MKGAFKGFLEKRKVNEPCRQKIVDDSKTGGGKIKTKAVIERDRKRGNY